MIINETDNADYFIYKFNISKKNQKRIKIIDNFFKENTNTKIFTENKLNKIFYYYGKQAVLDILYFKIIKSKRLDEKLLKLSSSFENKTIPMMPITADILMKKYQITEGKQLGNKLKMIEDEWVRNNFEISDKQVDDILKN